MSSSRSPLALLDTPPVWLLLAIALAWTQASLVPFWPTGAGLRLAGSVTVAVAVALFVAAALRFARARTTIVPREVPATLLTTGIYGVSRNPIYLADALLILGLVLMWDLGGLILVPAFMALIERRFIRGEEAVCAATFGTAWAVYAGRVRRWL